MPESLVCLSTLSSSPALCLSQFWSNFIGQPASPEAVLANGQTEVILLIHCINRNRYATVNFGMAEMKYIRSQTNKRIDH